MSVRRVVAGLVLAAAASGVAAVPAAASATTAPFTDPDQRGFIALCDLHGNNVAGGSIDTAPLIWKAVSSQPAPAAYRGKGENAALFIYQVRQDTPAAEWSGDTLSADTLYDNRNRPVAEMTYKDASLASIIAEFPPQWDGLYELRMQVGKLDYATYSATYPATVIQVTGKTWHVVRGGTLPCGGSARATSTELFSGGALTDPTSEQDETPVTAPSSVRAAVSTTPPNAQGGAVVPVGETAMSDAGGGDGSSNTAAIVVGIVAALVVVGVGGGLVWRRRSRT